MVFRCLLSGGVDGGQGAGKVVDGLLGRGDRVGEPLGDAVRHAGHAAVRGHQGGDLTQRLQPDRPGPRRPVP